MMDDWPPTLLPGMIAAVLAAIAWFGDWRRRNRRDPDAVGFMPWTTVFMLAMLAACTLLGLAARAWASRLGYSFR